MTILETFIKLRDDLKTWVTNNLNQKANISYVDEKFAAVPEFDPTEIQDAIDANATAIDTKVDKVEGKGLSTNDYTTAEKDKLSTVEANANFYEHPVHTSHSSGLYKITVDDEGHVSGSTAVEKEDILAFVEKDDIVNLGFMDEDSVSSEISDLNDRIDGVEGDLNTTNETLNGLSEEFESYKTTNNEAVSTNASGIEANKTAIEEIQSDYLTSENQQLLQDGINEVSEKATANAAAIEKLNGDEYTEGSVKQSINTAFNEFAANLTNNDVVDTYKELIDYAAKHAPEFDNLVAEVGGIDSRVGTIEADLPGYKETVTSRFDGIDQAIEGYINDTQEALEEKADLEHEHNDLYYTKDEILESITVDDIDDICGSNQIVDGDIGVVSYASKQWVQEGFQPKGDYLTDVPEGYATEEFVTAKIADAELGNGSSGSGACFVAQPEAPEDTSVLWLDTDDDSADSGGNAVQYTEQNLTEEQKAQARENIGAGSEAEINALLFTQSINLYDPALQTADTISPHYYVSGVPHSTTQFDSSYNATALIAVDGGTQYTIGLIPAYGEYKLPWDGASQGLFFYDKEEHYLGGTVSGTFTTPENCAYIRFNYAIIWGITLAIVNANCMLVKGDTLPEKYVAYKKTNLREQVEVLQKRVDGIAMPIQYSLTDRVLKVSYPYNEKQDFLVTLKEKGGNNLFDFASFALMDSGSLITNPTGETLIQSTITDWHAPFQIEAVNNADGDNINDAGTFRTYFTGGNHQYNNSGAGSTATARTVSLRFFANGKEITEGSGGANTIEIRWVNNVQGMNTTKADGTGREILQEQHTMIFDGIKWQTKVDLIPLEDIRLKLWYGFQCSGTNTIYNNIRFIGAVNRGLYSGKDGETHKCGDNTCHKMYCYGNSHAIEMDVDPTCDLGSMNGSHGNQAAFVSAYGKAYFTIIDYSPSMATGDIYSLKGSYRFFSV